MMHTKEIQEKKYRFELIMLPCPIPETAMLLLGFMMVGRQALQMINKKKARPPSNIWPTNLSLIKK